jgi:hypothetical protein
MRKVIDVGAMARIERGLSRLSALSGKVRKVPGKMLGSMRAHCTHDAVDARLEQAMQKIELYLQCRRKPTTLERALRRAVAAQGARR